MWSLRILSGELAGKVFPLKSGSNSVGRTSQCDVSIPLPGVSKHHAKIEILADKVVLSDSGSRNGTFVDGVAIKSQIIQRGQRLAIYDVICEIIPSAVTTSKPSRQSSAPATAYEAAAQAYSGNLALDHQKQHPIETDPQPEPEPEQTFASYVNRYINEVIMPGVYKIPSTIEFKNVILLFGLVLVISITALSTIPLTKILKKRIEKTSQQRAMTIARTLALRNQPILAAGQMTGLSTTEASNEPGVDKSFIISLEGRILAPAVLAQRDPEIPFIAEARRFGKEVVQQINDSTIGALVPIIIQNEQGLSQPMAHAVVIYDMGTLAVDDGQTFSLFVQTLVIALVVGSIVFFFLYKIIVFPILQLNSQLSTSLREGTGNISSSYLFPELQDLAGNIQSLLARGSAGGGGFDSDSNYEHERTFESAGLVNLVGFPAVAVQVSDRRILAINSHFQDQIAKSTDYNQISINEITDQALKLNLNDLVDRAAMQPNHPVTNDIDIDGHNFEVTGQAVFGSKEVNYVLIAFIPKVGDLA